MCLAIPMRVIAIDGFTARCAARGQERVASLFLFQHEPVAVGDHVLIQQGHVTAKVTSEDAAATWALYDEIFAAEAAAGPRACHPGPDR